MSKPRITEQSDERVERDRFGRMFVAITAPVITVVVGWLLGLSFATFFHLPSFLGGALGFIGGGFAALWILTNSFITNEPVVGAFVTVDAVQALIGNNGNVTYGPGGPHPCFFWEQREAKGNVNLSEVVENFTAKVQGPAGSFTVKYSVRLRPDITQLPDFLSGVAGIEGGIEGIISAFVSSYLADKNASDAGSLIKGLNEALKKEFEEGEGNKTISEFEDRFGIIIGDITVDELLPSDEVQKAMDGASEALALQRIVCQSLGYKDMVAVQEAVEKGVLSTKDVDRATLNAMTITNNLHGMNVGRQFYDIDINGDEDVVRGLKELIPHAAAVAARAGGGKKPKGGQKK